MDTCAETPYHAIDIVQANWPHLSKAFVSGLYDIQVDGAPPDEFNGKMRGCKELLLSPAIQGSGPLAPAVAWFGGLAPVWKGVAAVGAGLALRYVAYLLTPKPPTLEANTDPSNPSDLISGQLNQLSEGRPVPLCYGENVIEPLVISQTVVDEEETYLGVV